MSRRAGGLIHAATAVAVVLGSVSIALASGSASATASTAALHSLVPCRLLDTREPLDDQHSRSTDELTVEVDAHERCGVPADAAAVALTITVTGSADSGFVTAWSAGASRPGTASGTFGAGETRATTTIVQLDDEGRFAVRTSVPAGVVIDVTGAFVPAEHARSGRFVPLDATRIFDTRDGAPARAGEARNIAVTAPIAAAGVPADALAVAVVITATRTSGPGFVTAYPSGAAPPLAAALTVDRSEQTRSSFAVVALSPEGFSLRASMDTDLVVDLVGWFTGATADDSDAGLFVAATPARLLDTRERSPLGVRTPLRNGGGVELQWPGAGGVAVVVVTSVDGRPGFVTAWPAGTTRPATATLTMSGPGEVVTNLALSPLSERGIDLFANRSTHLVVDLVGEFTGARVPATEAAPTNDWPAPPELPRPSHGCAAYLPITAPDDGAELIGRSVQGRPIIAETYGDPAGRPVLIVGPVHGNECTPLILVERFRAVGREGRVPPGLKLVIIPSPNPDGLALGYRQNAHIADLNRDAVTRREPETNALLDFTARLQPILSIHLHSPLSTTGGQGGANDVGRAMAQIVADRTGLVMLRSMGSQPYYLWNAQARLVPGMAAVLIESPRGFPFDGNTASGVIRQGPAPTEALFDAITQALLDGMRLL